MPSSEVGARSVDPDRPSGPGFIALLEAFRATGGTVPGEIVARLLQEYQAGTAVSLARLVHSGKVFGFEWRGSVWIPMFQFDADDLRLNADAQRVRAELPPTWSGWRLACWFAGPSAWLEGRCPVDLLHSHPAAVLLAAQSGAPGEAFEPARRRRPPEVSVPA
jgi:hypothetical protein